MDPDLVLMILKCKDDNSIEIHMSIIFFNFFTLDLLVFQLQMNNLGFQCQVIKLPLNLVLDLKDKLNFDLKTKNKK